MQLSQGADEVRVEGTRSVSERSACLSADSVWVTSIYIRIRTKLGEGARVQQQYELGVGSVNASTPAKKMKKNEKAPPRTRT